MVRSLALMMVISMALTGCGDDSNGDGGSGGGAGSGGTAGAGGDAGMGGAGGSSGAGGATGEACVDDLAILAEIEDINALVTDTCIFGPFNCLLNDVTACVAGCLESEIGLPQDCGTCIGEVTECIVRACATDCVDPDAASCDPCIATASETCDPEFEACAGFPAP